MTDESEKPPIIISLAAKRKESERDFAQERTDILKELTEIGVDADQLAAITQHVMFLEWAVFKSALMLQYHGLDQDAQAVVELVRLMVYRK